MANDARGRTKRPGGLTAVAVIGLCLGILGILAAGVGVVGAISQGFLASAQIEALEEQRQMSGDPHGMIERQIEFQREANAIQERFLPFTLPQQAFNGLVSAAMLFGAILLLQWKRSGPAVFTGAAAASMLNAVVATILGIVIQIETVDALQSMMGGLLSDPALGQSGQDVGNIMETATSVGGYVGIAFGLAWGLAKLVYYAWAIAYLRRPAVRSLFAA